jgi:hypothetical protein
MREPSERQRTLAAEVANRPTFRPDIRPTFGTGFERFQADQCGC